MKSFDELARFHNLSLIKWDEDNYASVNTQLAKDFYEAGQQSKQAEIDSLTKQRDSFIKAHHISMNDVCDLKSEIDELRKHKEILLGEVYLMGDAIQYHRILNLLKGNTNED